MSDPLFTKAHFQQLISERNESLKDKIRFIYISTAKSVLMSPPFSYSEKISKQVSDGIVNYGDKLTLNAVAESDDEDDEIEELNQMGDDFQTMVPITALELTIDSSVGGNFLKPVHNLYPMPEKGFPSANQASTSLREIRNYLKLGLSTDSRQQ